MTYSYDNRGRVLTDTVQVNSLPEATVSYSYDGIGRLSEVTYGNGVSESRTYTVQGWLKEKNEWGVKNKRGRPVMVSLFLFPE